MSDLSKVEASAIAHINEILDSFFKRTIQQSQSISPYYGLLWRDIFRLISSGGKRVRPRMTILAYEAFGGTNSDNILPVAAAQELLHLGLLIHDDIIDRDYIRYGVDNITGSYEKQYYTHVLDPADRLHYAQSAAILGGDLMISSSYQLMFESNISAENLITIMKVHSNSIFEVAGGELIDTESAFRPLGEVDAKTVARYKTASYTFIGPLLAGAIPAGISDKNAQTLQKFAENLGIAYQLRDDVIGIFGDELQTGKTTTGDIREGKHTYMIEQFYALASDENKMHFELYFGDKDIQKSEAEIIKELLRSTNALRRTEEIIDDYAARARAALDELNIAGQYHTQFDELITKVTKRDY